MTDLDPRACAICGIEFQPKPRGYNAKYCSKACKIRGKPKRKIAYSSEYYFKRKADPEIHAKIKEQGRLSKKKVRDWLAQYKLDSGCIDCGYNEHACALELDHNGPKEAAISELRSSKKRIMNEIEKGRCVVRCSNCHAVKTWKEKNGMWSEGNRL